MFSESDALGPALRLLRLRRHVRQYEVAGKATITKAMLSSYETGKATPSLRTLMSILRALESDFIEFQGAVEALSGKRTTPEEAAEAHEDLTSCTEQEARMEILEFLTAKLGALEGALRKIADSLEIVASTEPPPPPVSAPERRRARSLAVS